MFASGTCRAELPYKAFGLHFGRDFVVRKNLSFALAVRSYFCGFELLVFCGVEVLFLWCGPPLFVAPGSYFCGWDSYLLFEEFKTHNLRGGTTIVTVRGFK